VAVDCCNFFTLAAASFIPLTGAMAVQSRWGQKAAYVPTQQSIYFIGGQVSVWNAVGGRSEEIPVVNEGSSVVKLRTRISFVIDGVGTSVRDPFHAET
jgi:hypothetical protein